VSLRHFVLQRWYYYLLLVTVLIEDSEHVAHVHGVATISRLLQIIGLSCRISSLLHGSFEKETHHFKEPIIHSHPILLVERERERERLAFYRFDRRFGTYCASPSQTWLSAFRCV